MFDVGASELLVIVIAAVLVIGPKDLPLALRTAGRWIGKVRRVSAQFRTGFDAMVREAEMEDMEKKWKEQNARIMAEAPPGAPSDDATPSDSGPDTAGDSGKQADGGGGGEMTPLAASADSRSDAAGTVQDPASETAGDEPILPLRKPKAE
jgi:sec-independent protein translocase protein TatB